MPTEYKKIEHYKGTSSNLSTEIRDKMLGFNTDTKRLHFAETKALGWTVFPNWADLATKENSIGNPSVSGQFLTSTSAGVRSWKDISDGSWGAIVAPDNGSTGATKWIKLATITTNNSYTNMAGVVEIIGGYLGSGSIRANWRISSSTTVGMSTSATSVSAFAGTSIDPAKLKLVVTKTWSVDSENEAELWFQAPSSNAVYIVNHSSVRVNTTTSTWTPNKTLTWVTSPSAGTDYICTHAILANSARLLGLTGTGNRGVIADSSGNLSTLDAAGFGSMLNAVVKNPTATQTIDGQNLRFLRNSYGNFCISTGVSGDAQDRLVIDSAGRHFWGDGTNARDTSLYRGGVNLLESDDSFQVSDGIRVRGYDAAAFTADGGSGVELHWNSTYGRLMSYNRTSSTWEELRIAANETIFYSAGIEAGRFTSTGDLNLVNLTASRVVVTDASKNLVSSSMPSSYLDATSSIQTQLNAKMTTSSYPDLVAIEALAGTTGLLKKTAANTWTLDTNTYLTSIADNSLTIAKTTGLQTALDAKMSISSNPDLVAIEALSGTSGILKKTAANTWALDTNSYLTANQTITLSGIVTGSGTTAITTSIADNALSIAKTSGLQTALNAKLALIKDVNNTIVGTAGEEIWQTFTASNGSYEFFLYPQGTVTVRLYDHNLQYYSFVPSGNTHVRVEMFNSEFFVIVNGAITYAYCSDTAITKATKITASGNGSNYAIFRKLIY